jgi:hypothetical protein
MVCEEIEEQSEGVRFRFVEPFPANYSARGSERRKSDCVLENDTCVIGSEEHYIRGCIEIPVMECDETFSLAVWALVSEEVFRDVTGQGNYPEHDPGCLDQGRIGNDLAEIGNGAWMVRCTVQTRRAEELPLFHISKPGHPLAVLQQCGMSEAEAVSLAAKFRSRILTR